jgi:hypothetical protein
LSTDDPLPSWHTAILVAIGAVVKGFGFVLIFVAIALGAGACGSDDAQPSQTRPQRLTAAERAAAQSGYEAIRSYCRRLGMHLAGRGPAPGPGNHQRAIEGARRIAALARRKPEAPYSVTQTAGQLAGDTAEDLEGTNCSGRLVDELARGL